MDLMKRDASFFAQTSAWLDLAPHYSSHILTVALPLSSSNVSLSIIIVVIVFWLLLFHFLSFSCNSFLSGTLYFTLIRARVRAQAMNKYLKNNKDFKCAWTNTMWTIKTLLKISLYPACDKQCDSYKGQSNKSLQSIDGPCGICQ